MISDDTISNYQIYGIGEDFMIDKVNPEYLMLKLLIIIDIFEEKDFLTPIMN